MTTQAIDYQSPAANGTRITQSWALVVDSYRELNSKKLFWITLILSLLVVIAFAFVTINDRGISIFGADFENYAWSTNVIPAATFYKVIFTSIAIPWWLGVIATVLALISVCSVFPDFITGGSIDLYLSKPLSRLRLFATKYLVSLMFVALQVFVFAAASFLLIGLKSGAWELGIFLAVPLVTLFFSYLYCVCVLTGIITRSALASLLVTMLFWLFLFALNTTDAVLMTFKSAADVRLEEHRGLIERNQKIIDTNQKLSPGNPTANAGWQLQLDGARETLPRFEKDAAQLQWWYSLFRYIKTPLPKTGETVDLMTRWLVEPEPLMRMHEESQKQQDQRREARRNRNTADGAPPPTQRNRSDRLDPEDPDVMRRVQQESEGRTAVKLIGTSLGFELAVLGLAAFIFCRRDF
ncbi:MAG TPA: ABC transporter permease [Tepidisphaeraceae bacterium]|nr:ABC transporter permease [Tepidisphaeraceae bacterium]